MKVYSKDDLELFDEDGNTNMLYTDGKEPSEFDLYNPPVEDQTDEEEETP